MTSFPVPLLAVAAVVSFGLAFTDESAPTAQQTSQKAASTAAKPAPSAGELDGLLAPIALYPDQLLAQMLLCASNPGKVATLGEWLASQTLKGTELQDAATKSGFEPSFVALVAFSRKS